MKKLTLLATLTAALSFGAAANEQHYTFTYDFSNGQDNIVQIAHETSEMIHYQAVLDVLFASNNTILEVGESTVGYVLLDSTIQGDTPATADE